MSAEGRQSSDNQSDASDGSIERTSGTTGKTRGVQWVDKFSNSVGEDLVSAFHGRNWTVTGAVLFTLGIVSDLASITGPVSKYGLYICSIAGLVLGTIIFFRLKARSLCVTPFFSALLLAVTFSIVLGVQNLANATESGVIVEKFPQASKIQQAMFGKLEEILDSQSRIEVKLNQLIAEFERSNPNADPGTVEAFREAAESLAASGDARKRKALSDFANGREDRAIIELTRLAEDQSAAAQDSVDQAAETWKEVGALAFHTDTDQALRAYEKTVELHPNDLVARHQLGLLLSRLGDVDGAKVQFEAVLMLSSTSDGLWKAIALDSLGIIESDLGALDAAEDFFKRSLAINEALGQKRGIGVTLGNLGIIERTRGNLNVAADYFLRSLGLAEELGQRDSMALQLSNLGVLVRMQGNLDASEDYHKGSLAIYEELGRKLGISSQLNSLGLIQRMRGNFDSAESHHLRSLAIVEELGKKADIAAGLGNLGTVALERRDLDVAEDYYKRSLKLEEELGDKEGIANTLGNLFGVELNRNRFDSAEEYIRRSGALHTELGNKLGVATATANLGVLEYRRDNRVYACYLWIEAEKVYASVSAKLQQDSIRERLDTVCADVKEAR